MIARFGFGRLAIRSSFAIIAFGLEFQEGGGCGGERSAPSRGLVEMHSMELVRGLKPPGSLRKRQEQIPLWGMTERKARATAKADSLRE